MEFLEYLKPNPCYLDTLSSHFCPRSRLLLLLPRILSSLGYVMQRARIRHCFEEPLIFNGTFSGIERP